MSDVARWFRNEVLWWRTVACLTWFCIFLPSLLLAANFCFPFPFIQPFSAFADAVGLLLQQFFWRDVIIVALAFALLCQGHLFTHTAQYPEPCNPLVAFGRLFWPVKNLGLHAIHATVGLLLTFVSLDLSEQLFAWSEPCTQDPQQSCLSSDVVFLVLHGAFAGLWFSVRFLLGSENRLVFPTVRQGRYFRVKTALLGCFWKSCIHALQVSLIFHVLYIIVGAASTLGLVWVDMPSLPLPWYNPGVTRFALGSAIFIQFCMRFFVLLFQVFHTQPVSFAVQALLVADKQRLLSSAMQCQQLPLVQYLAYQDFARLSSSAKERHQVFTLAQSGGQAASWEMLSSECLTILQSLTTRLRGDSAAPTPSTTETTSTPATSTSQKGWPAPPAVANSNVPVRRSVNKGADMWAKSPVSRGFTPAQVSPVPGRPKSRVLPENFQQNAKAFWTSLKNLPKNLPTPSKSAKEFLNRIWPKPGPEAEEQLMYCDALKHIWATQGLCNLVVASYTEDKYGLVQQKFSQILDVLLGLLQAVEHARRKSQAKTLAETGGRLWPVRSHVLVQQTLHSTLQSGIYQIVSTFRDHLHLFKLKPENEQRLKAFLSYQE